MKTSTVLIAALVLIIVFVGGMSASELADMNSTKQSVTTIELGFDLDQMIESSGAQIREQSRFGNQDVRGMVVSDFERPM